MIDVSDPVVSRMLARVRADTPALVERMADEISDRVHIYQRDLKTQLSATLMELLTRFGQGDIGETDQLIPWVSRDAEHRMTRGVPLEDLLAAWRIGTDVLWEWYLETALTESHPGPALRLWTQFLNYVDRDISAVSAVYATAREDTRLGDVAHLETALDAEDPRLVSTALHEIGVTSEHIIVAVCSMPDQATTPPNGRFKRQQYGPALGRLTATGQRPTSVVRDGHLLTVVDAGPQTHRLAEHAHGADLHGIRMGLSKPTPRASTLRTSLAQALTALQCTSDMLPICTAGNMSATQVVATRARLHWNDLPDWSTTFLVADQLQHGEFRETARALLAANGRVSDAAEQLSLHPNSIYYRISMIQRATTVDLRNLETLAALHLIEELLRLGAITGVPENVA